MIESTELMSNLDLIKWLEVLNNGYVKPDMNKVASHGTVRETKDFKPFIMKINSKLCENANMECPDVSQFLNFKVSAYND